jgi:hypothetical protein
LPARIALRQLAELRGGLTARQLAVRKEAFGFAERWIVGAARQGGVEVVARPVIRTFQNTSLPWRLRSARVDLEVLSGVAFVCHPGPVRTGEEA